MRGSPAHLAGFLHTFTQILIVFITYWCSLIFERERATIMDSINCSDLEKGQKVRNFKLIMLQGPAQQPELGENEQNLALLLSLDILCL